MATANKQSGDITYIAIYFLEWLTGLIFFVISGNDKRKKLHSLQAIILGVIAVVVYVVIGIVGVIIGLWFIGSLFGLLIWLYGLYVGYMASTGVDVQIPMVTDLAKQYA